MLSINSIILPDNSYGYQFFHEIIDLTNDEFLIDSMNKIIEIKETIDEKIYRLSLGKESMPQNVPKWVIAKWRKRNSGDIIEIKDRIIALDSGNQIRLPLLDSQIKELNRISNQLKLCIERKESLYFKKI